MGMDSDSERPNATRQPKVDPIGQRVAWLSTPHLFAVATLVLLAGFEWPRRWLISGAPILTYSVLLGAEQDTRFLPYIPLWPFFTTLHLLYCIAATSWLLYWAFAAMCYALIFFSCLFQFDFAGRFVRRRLRGLLKGSHLINDKLALFNLPALDIDTEVDGLFVIRGVVVSLSSLKIVAHGVEVGIKLNNDMELALTTDKVSVSLFRKIEIDDVYANLKGGAYEMTFGGDVRVNGTEEGDPGQSSLLRKATLTAQDLITPMVERTEEPSWQPVHKVSRKPVPATSPQEALESALQSVTMSDDSAKEQYEAALEQIHKTSLITKSRNKIAAQLDDREAFEDSASDPTIDRNNDKHMRAAICVRLHNKPSIPHPPQKSIAVSTLRNQSSPATRRFLHRLPMLLRLLLNPLSYFHPIKIASVTAGGSGRYIQHVLSTYVFKHYSDKNADIRRLEVRVNKWLADANFVLQLDAMAVLAHVPFLTTYDIDARLTIADFIVYRVLQEGGSVAQVIRLRGADASVTIPSFLLPHHEHLLPAVPTAEDIAQKEKEADQADGVPDAVEAAVELEQTLKDEVNIKVSARARLPAVFDQQLLDFVAALVKATKFIEIEKSLEGRNSIPTDDPAVAVPSSAASDAASDEDEADAESVTSVTSTKSPRWSDFKVSVKALNKKAATGMEKTWRRGIVGGMANDRWIAKLVGKVTRLLETVRGDVGYSVDVPVPLAPYRAAAEDDAKILA